MKADKYCIRCRTEKLTQLPESSAEISFYICQQCNWKFSQRAGKSLTDAWPSPLSLLLYGIIFDPEPEQKAQAQAELLIKQKTREEIDLIVKEIRRELENPTQRVSEIHDLAYRPSEEKVRKFLSSVIEYLEKELN